MDLEAGGAETVSDIHGRNWRILLGDVRERLADIEPDSVHCVCTSPPYWALRDYQVDGQIGSEPTLAEYVAVMVDVFEGVKRVLRPDGVCFVNLGDTYAANRSYQVSDSKHKAHNFGSSGAARCPDGLKPKDLCMVPARVALALQDAGWWLRSEIIWCLSGGTKVYARTQKGDMPMSVREMSRLDPSTVQLWNGEKWTQVLGMSETAKPNASIEIELRSGETICCTHGHVWPTERGNVRADELEVGDVVDITTLPSPDEPFTPEYIDDSVAWLLGLYLGDGSVDSKGRIQLAGHEKEWVTRFDAIVKIARKFGGTTRCYTDGNKSNIVVDCPALAAIMKQYIHGSSAKTKGIKTRAWRHSNDWLEQLLNGYLSADGHWDQSNRRWRLSFTRNDRLACDLRTICARLGIRISLKKSTSRAFGKQWKTYKGELRWTQRREHHNAKSRSEIIAIRKGRGRRFFDIGVADEPHLFALASGVLTHNSKPNPMPESTTDRPTKAHEMIYMLTKRPRYFYDDFAVRVPAAESSWPRLSQDVESQNGSVRQPGKTNGAMKAVGCADSRNLRTVWEIATQSYDGAHFATFPEKLPETCIKAGTSERGCCAECGAPWKRVVEKSRVRTRPGADTKINGRDTDEIGNRDDGRHVTEMKHAGWEPTCDCGCEETRPCIVLDLFNGSGTTGKVAVELGREYIGIELNPEYAELARDRITNPKKYAVKGMKQVESLDGQQSLF